MLAAEILSYYRLGNERARLASAGGRLEFLRTWDVLTRVLPPAPARVLDVGGATGVYAGPLADAGYAVHVVDPVPDHVAESAALPGVRAEVGDARALTQPDASVDAVLLLGPLYHLLEREERLRVWQEAARVVRPGGVVVAATITRFASLFDGYVKGYYNDDAYLPTVRQGLADGRHRNDDPDRPYFTTAYLHHPDEIGAEVSDAGLTVQQIVAVENALCLVRDRLDDVLADPARTAVLLDQLRTIETEPSLLGASAHLLTVARR